MYNYDIINLTYTWQYAIIDKNEQDEMPRSFQRPILFTAYPNYGNRPG
jgi:hypothetical protein